MALTTAGMNAIAEAITGRGTFFNNANAHLGVGNGTTAFNRTQTNLTGSQTVRKALDVGYPLVVPPAVIFSATFGPNEANFAWNEWAVFNAATGGTMLNRAVESNGTKQNNQTWVLEVTITFTAEA